MIKRISESAGARVHAALVKGKEKGENIITWTVHYKDESKWCNTEEEVILALRQVTLVQLHGEKYKTWTIGKGGWRKNTPNFNV